MGLDGDSASGETYCLVQHLHDRDGVRTLLVTAIRYLDRFIRVDGRWLIADRKLIIDWTDQHPSSPQR